MAKDAKGITLNPRPQKRGNEWYVEATYPRGDSEQVLGFKSESEAQDWIIGPKSKEWLKKRGYGDD